MTFAADRDDGPESGWQPTAYHRPILVDEVNAGVGAADGVVVFDGTAGGGGHSEALLEAGCRVIACDRDSEAVAHASRRLQHFGNRFVIRQSPFSAMGEVLRSAGVETVDAVLLDLGVSSRQLDDGRRGFSFMRPGPLDMRMDASTGRSAADWVNESSAEELARIFREYGEERRAKRVAERLVVARANESITTTERLASLVAEVVPRHGPRHPATQVFQALRMAVNDELGELERGLQASLDCLKPGGRLAVITFHSLEDRIVKRFMKERSLPWIDRPEWPAPKANPAWVFDQRLPKPVVPGKAEVSENPRSRSSRLRVAVMREPSTEV